MKTLRVKERRSFPFFLSKCFHVLLALFRISHPFFYIMRCRYLFSISTDNDDMKSRRKCRVFLSVFSYQCANRKKKR